MITIISNKKSERTKILFKFHDYTNLFDKINVNKLFKYKFHDYAIETKSNCFFRFYL